MDYIELFKKNQEYKKHKQLYLDALNKYYNKDFINDKKVIRNDNEILISTNDNKNNFTGQN